MSAPNVAFFRSIYSAMDAEEFAEMLRKAALTPGELTAPALEAISQIVAERRIDVRSALRDEQSALTEDRAIAVKKAVTRAQKSKKSSLVMGRITGGIGLACGVGVLVLSLSAGHVGGAIASVAWIITAAWMLFGYKGD